MATNFPTSLDNLTNPAGSDPVNNPSHASQHANINDAIEVLETKVGVNNSAVTTSLDYRVKQLETNPTYTNEMAQDAVAAALAAGTHTNITINYNDTGNSISISAAAGYTNEEAVDAVAAALTAGSGISVSYNDPANTITISIDNTIATKTYVDTAVSNLGSTAASTYVPVSDVGNADGVASLDSNGLIPDSQIPAGVARDSEVSSAISTEVTNRNSAISTAVNNLINSAPDTLDTLGEIATALAADESAAAALTTVVNGKVSKAGGDTITASTASTVPLKIKSATSQSANLQEWQSSGGSVISRIDSNGVFNATAYDYGVNTGYPEIIWGGNNTTATIRREYRSSISKFGITTGTFHFGSNPDNANFALTDNQVGVFARSTTLPSFIIKSAASQTANLQEWQNSSGTVRSAIDANGFIIAGNSTAISNAIISAQPYGASQVGVAIRAASGQTADLQQWQNSAGTVLARITSTGVIGTTQNVYSSRYYYSSNGTDTGTSISFIDGTNGGGLNIRNIDLGTPNAGFDNIVPLTISGNINQTANLQNWKNAAGTVLAKVDSTGAMFTTTAAANTNTTQVATTAYVQTELADLVNSAPATLDTLKELSDALGADANFATTVTNNLAFKAPLASPALTGTPTAPTATAGTNTTQLATTAFVKTELSTSIQPGALYQTSAPASPAVGQIWIDSDEDVTTFDPNIIRRKAITATAGQTVFTADLPFIDGFEQIFMNGLLLVKTTDYATSGGNTVTLTSAAAASDIIEIVSVTGANSVNTYTQAEVNALLAANTSVAPLSISANTTLVAKKRYFVTSASALTLTLPASPALNDEIQIVDASGNASTYNITVARNANKINGGLNNLIIDTNGGWYTLLYTGATYGWKVG